MENTPSTRGSIVGSDAYHEEQKQAEESGEKDTAQSLPTGLGLSGEPDGLVSNTVVTNAQTNDNDEISTHMNKRGSMINGATEEELKHEREKLKTAGELSCEGEGEGDEAATEPEQSDLNSSHYYTPTTKRGSMINGATDLELEKEREKIESKREEKRVSDEARDTEKEDATDSSPTSQKSRRMLRGSMINGASESELEEEKRKMGINKASDPQQMTVDVSPDVVEEEENENNRNRDGQLRTENASTKDMSNSEGSDHDTAASQSKVCTIL